MGWTTAPLAVKLVTIAVFFGIATVFGVGAYKPANPQWPLLIFASVGMAALAAWCVLKVGNLVTHPRTREEAAFWTSRDSYNRRSVPLMMQFALIVAMSLTCIAYILDTADTGSWRSAWTAALLFVVVIWPFVRHRIERGRWPD